jgi:hypothetical protein
MPSDAHGEVISGKVPVGGEIVTVRMRSHFWLQWGEIAAQHLDEAKGEREIEEQIDRSIPDPENPYNAALGRETKAAMIAISASAHAIDAWFGAVAVLIDPARYDQPRSRGPRRRFEVLEMLKRGFTLRAKAHRWRDEIDWLFTIRDDAVHFKEADRDTALHPTGTGTSAENVTYSVESATRAVELLRDVLETCRVTPKKTYPALIRYVDLMGGTIDDLVKRLAQAAGASPRPGSASL